ncbi:50S ribosomal protein L33 [Periweissella beninensis]|nr:50S ribosomal protein L33 [Periweissella beninensis]MCT4396703.1 50S ribosomal protein L33 [Periweissella beninensis]
MRINIILAAPKTGERLYLTQKNRRHTPDKLVLKKYSPKLRQVTEFIEVK